MKSLMCLLAGSAILVVLATAAPGGDTPKKAKKAKGPTPAQYVKDVQLILEQTNAERAKEMLRPYKLNTRLTQAAQAHSENMAKQGTLEHDLDGKRPSHRISKTGYRWTAYGENIALAPAPRLAMQRWMRSSGHKANILAKQYTEIGIGIARDAEGLYYVTQVFARPQ